MPGGVGMSVVGVAITTYNRRGTLEATLDEWARLHDGPLVVIDDGSEIPVPQSTRYELVRHPDNLGIAAAKNTALHTLEAIGCTHMVLADDDTIPTRDTWADELLTAGQPFLIHGFANAPSHWPAQAEPFGDHLLSWDKPRGCLIYLNATDILPVVGGLHVGFGKHGGEHGNWADRIHQAGITPAPHLSLADSPFHCYDQDQPGISSVVYNSNWRNVDPDRLPLYADYHPRPIPVLVPRRNDHGHRDRLWRWTQDAYWNRGQGKGYRIVEGHHVEGPFNRSAALNLAAELAGNWDVAVIADSDAWVPPEQLDEAVRLARQTNRLVSAFTEVHEVAEKETLDLLAVDYAPRLAPARRIRTAALETQSVMLAVTRNLWEQVRGFDPVHNGWGGEDNSFWRACHIATGEPLRVEGPAFTLWHEPASREHQPTNASRFAEYQRARTLADIHRLRA